MPGVEALAKERVALMGVIFTSLAEPCLVCEKLIFDDFVYVGGARYVCDECYEGKDGKQEE